ncbi:MAG TPA: cytochrome c oxidase assembly protein [Pirellulales bacterium]|nr:cytochrome c oxidase assembly protein [Pirellulales bacterium]
MSPTLAACLRSWPFDPWLLASLLLAAGVYLRGWLVLRRRDRTRWHGGRPAAFLGGLAAIYLALASPLEPFAGLLLQVHMVQHLLLMMAAPPLLWLGTPLFPLLRGLPRSVRMFWFAPLLSAPPLRRFFGRLTHPLAALALFVAATWAWHAPPVYDLALRSNGWHYLQHACFLGTALVFWYPIVRPYPARPRWSPWLLLPCLFLADLSNTALSALLTFSNRLLYPYYAEVPRLAGLSPLDDQSAAGVIMWVPGSVAFLLPLFSIGVRLLSGQRSSIRSQRCDVRRPKSRAGAQGIRPLPGRTSLPVVRATSSPASDRRPATSGFDVLRLPLLGRFLKWRHARLCMQVPLLLLAGLIVYDGFRGPPVGAMNLAGVLPWIHWRGLVVVGLLAAGNVFCMACPFTVPRTFARRWLPQGRSWPRLLRNKWLAVLLLAGFLWAYEAFALWDSPWWTAWIVLIYFAAAFVVDGFFRGASFCKYVCPIGQFNFVQSLISPLEIKVRDSAVCVTCRTKDCIRGRDDVPGCELQLYQPRKSSNMDCTFCLDCIHACPHDNVGILVEPPAKELWHDSFRSGVGRFSKRPDLAALVVVLVFGAFVNAAGMVAPVLEWRDQLASVPGLGPPILITSLSFVFGLVMLPLLMFASAAVLCRWFSQVSASSLELATRFSYALVPLGFSMWLAHYSFHFLASFGAAASALARFAGDHGWAIFGEPEWARACCRPVADWLPRLEILSLDLGLLLSLYAGYRIALAQAPWASQALKLLAPWTVLIVLLFAAGVWIVLQPMQMRGTL